MHIYKYDYTVFENQLKSLTSLYIQLFDRMGGDILVVFKHCE